MHDTPCRRLKVEDPEWLWFRPNSRNPSMHPELHAQNQYEKIAVVNGGEAVLVEKSRANVLVYDAEYSNRIHEMQRPHDFCKEIIRRFTLPGERVVDLCFGSGSALAAAADLKRDFLGCDINPKNRGPAIGFVSTYYNG
jgi:DNA modification methylase